MAHSDSVSNIKRAMKESVLRRELSMALLQISEESPDLRGLSVSRVQLSHGKGMCNVYFYTAGGEAEFKEKLKTLKLYKPSLRTMLAHNINSRYTPDLFFKFDEQMEKSSRMEGIMDKLDVGEEK